MYNHSLKLELRERIGVIRDRSSKWALFWILLTIVLVGLSIWADNTDPKDHLKGVFGLAIMISAVCTIVMIIRTSRFTKYHMNPPTEFPAKDHKRIYREDKKER